LQQALVSASVYFRDKKTPLADHAIEFLPAAFRRQELAGLRIEDIQQRDGRWCIVDLAG